MNGNVINIIASKSAVGCTHMETEQDKKALIRAHTYAHTHKHTRTHTQPFNGPLSGTTWVNLYQKGKTNLDFTEARESEWQWH